MTAAMTLPYCKAGVTPGWQFARVVDAETGEAFRRVLEANADEGWVVRVRVNERDEIVLSPSRQTVEHDRLERPIRIELTPDGARLLEAERKRDRKAERLRAAKSKGAHL